MHLLVSDVEHTCILFSGQYFTFNAEPGYKITGVPYHERDIYQMESWHFHFGRGDFEGSEHTIDGRYYAGEVSNDILPIVPTLEPRHEKICLRIYRPSHATNQTGQPQKMARGLPFRT